jgi:hypothetical protein
VKKIRDLNVGRLSCVYESRMFLIPAASISKLMKYLCEALVLLHKDAVVSAYYCRALYDKRTMFFKSTDIALLVSTVKTYWQIFLAFRFQIFNLALYENILI